jgi:JAB N-terminal domain
VSVEIELYRTDDYVRAGRLPLGPLLRTVFEPVVGGSLEDALFQLTFLRLADDRPLDGTPTLVNLRSGHGYLSVRIVLDGRVVYRHPHSLREIVAVPLQRLLAARFPAENHWGYGVQGLGLDQVALVRPAPRAEHELEVGSGGARPQRFHVEEVADPPPPPATLAGLGVPDGADDPAAPITVVLRPAAFDGLVPGAVFSDEVEEGGFLAGHVYRDAADPERRLLEVTAVITAERTGASLLQFTFTGESFLRISEQLRRRGLGERLVGWYHTHLFPASDALGLSSIDEELHRSTFRRPWQVAGLVNLDGAARVLRFYRSGHEGSRMAPAPYAVAAQGAEAADGS